MSERPPLKDIAYQAGLSLATVDRVIHQRAGVRAVTRHRVDQAIKELQEHYAQSKMTSSKMVIDVIIEGPERFTSDVRRAFLAEFPFIQPASFSARYHFNALMQQEDIEKLLRQIKRRGSHGVVLKIPSRRKTNALAESLRRAGIPVLTYVTDLPVACRDHYIGMDNLSAGGTAAWIMGKIQKGQNARVLISLSRANFLGEEERLNGFRTVISERFPDLEIAVVSEGKGADHSTYRVTSEALDQYPDICAVYSASGGNHAILSAFADHRRKCTCFIAHDLDQDNKALLAKGQIDFVLHHDFRADARAICQTILKSKRMMDREFEPEPSGFTVHTPYT